MAFVTHIFVISNFAKSAFLVATSKTVKHSRPIWWVLNSDVMYNIFELIDLLQAVIAYTEEIWVSNALRAIFYHLL